MSNARRRAEQLYDEVLVTGPRKVCIDQILAYGREQRQAVWEEAGTEAMRYSGAVSPSMRAELQRIADWCRQQAREEG